VIRLPVATLDGAALAWAVAIAEKREPILLPPTYGLPWRVAVVEAGRLIAWRPERDWNQGGPLLDQWCKGFGMVQDLVSTRFRAFAYGPGDYSQRLGGGPTILVAACRARVLAVLGETVELPPELAPVQAAA
jgi:hypothetical protein